MGKKFILKVPRKPILRRQTYDIPQTYIDAYSEAGITDSDEQIMLFHITQFGGFRIKETPYLDKNFVEKWFKSEHSFGYHHFRANTNFLLKFGGLEIQPLEKRWKSKVLDYEGMKEYGFSDDEINDSIEFLTKLNDFYSSLRLNILQPQSGITAEDRIDLSKFHGIPFLVKKPKAGGRFFNPETSYQRISSSLRQMITINGNKTSEFDISASTLQFLNIGLEKYASESIRDTILSNDDPYEYFLSTLNSDDFLMQYREHPIDRESVKEILYTVIYSPNSSQKAHVNRKLRLMKRGYNYFNLVQSFPEFFNALSKLSCKTKSQLHMIIFKEESNYAQEVLQKGCLEYKLPIIPIHDSFMTTTANTERLEEIMNAASKKLFGRRLLYKQKY